MQLLGAAVALEYTHAVLLDSFDREQRSVAAETLNCSFLFASKVGCTMPFLKPVAFQPAVLLFGLKEQFTLLSVS